MRGTWKRLTLSFSSALGRFTVQIRSLPAPRHPAHAAPLPEHPSTRPLRDTAPVQGPSSHAHGTQALAAAARAPCCCGSRFRGATHHRLAAQPALAPGPANAHPTRAPPSPTPHPHPSRSSAPVVWVAQQQAQLVHVHREALPTARAHARIRVSHHAHTHGPESAITRTQTDPSHPSRAHARI